ncbi:MAG: T9SS type A sorting domain-containing protein [Chitinophagales bacterium]
MKKVRFWFLLTLLGLSLSGIAQSFHLRITSDSTSSSPLPDSLNLGSDYSFKIRIYNDTLFDFMDGLTLGYKVDTTNFSTPVLTGGLEYPLTITDTIHAFSYITVNMIAHVDGPAFKTGPSVVVIWPINSHNDIYYLDPYIDSFTVFEANAVVDLEGSFIRLHYTKGALLLQSPEIDLKQVRIFDLQGRLIVEQKDPGSQVPLPPLQQGIYLAELLYNNQRKAVRFLAY